MDRQPITALHVDPDPESRAEVAHLVAETEGMEVSGVRGVESALEQFETERIDCLVSAYELPDGTAFDLFQEAREQNAGVGCLLYTAEQLTEIDRSGTADMVVEYLSKRIPGTEERLPELVRSVVLGRRQVGYPVPDDENERLAAVSRYRTEELSSGPAFDRLVRLAQQYFEVDVALIGLMGDTEEEIIACRGDQWSMFDRGETVCAYAMLESDLTVIEDVMADPRFAGNDYLESLGVRSYAGVNLTTPGGHIIGELCLTHGEPRSYDETERDALELFAEEVMEQLELRRQLTETMGAVEVGE